MTDKQSQYQPDPQSVPSYENEINLADYLRVIWKWKWFIVAGVLICTIVAGILSFQMPKIYEISMVIEPGIASVNDDGSFIYIDTAENMSGKIEGKVYNRRVEEALQLDPLKTKVEFKSTIVRETSVIKITSQWQEEDTALGMKAIREMISLLSGDYERIVKHRKGAYDEQIKLKLNSIEKTQNEIKLQSATLNNIRQRKEELLKEITGVEENTKRIIQERGTLLKDENPNKDLSLLLYSTTIQQNVTYSNQLSNQNYELGVREKGTENKISELNKVIDDTKSQIDTLNLEKMLISNIKIIQEQEISPQPVTPNKRQIILLAGVVSLFTFVLLAFFIECMKKASREE